MIIMNGMTELNEGFWSNRYKTGSTGWDLQHASLPLVSYIDTLEDKEQKILIPGAGNAYEAEYLWHNGFRNIYVLDISKEPISNIKGRLPELREDQLIIGDFFQHQNQYDIILEQTFFCAIDPKLRTDYQKHTFNLLNPKGILAGVFFDFPLNDVGPPFGGSKDEYEKLFGLNFNIKKLEFCYNSELTRQGKELFFIFEK